jgi:hypothetical protein
MGADFSGWATKVGLKCADGRTITTQAFQHMDKVQVPLLWHHGHDNPENVLGHVMLEWKPEGVRIDGYFNDTKAGQTAKALVVHKDITALSIWANQLIEKSKQVLHGMIREVSLVIAGANPGALIDNVNIQHADGSVDTVDDEVIIYTGLPIELSSDVQHTATDDLEHAADDTVRDVYESMTDEQKNLMTYMLARALEAQQMPAAHSDISPTDNQPDGTSPEDTNPDDKPEGDLEHQEGNDDMVRNVFDQTDVANPEEQHVLSHDAMKGIFADAARMGSLKEAVTEYALKHGIDNIDILFPNAKNITGTPDFIKRRTEWVAGVLNGVSHTPFARIKTLLADITMDEARAKGYIKGNLKKEEFFTVSRRTTGPTLVYKKQKLDRQDIIDITDFDVVVWVKGEMRLMLEEELARAILIGDGRDPSDTDKIKDPIAAQDGIGIRSILNDHEMYVTKVYVNDTDASSSQMEVVDGIVSAMQNYHGTGTPTFYTTLPRLTKLLLQRDTLGHRIYRNAAELASELGVDQIVTVEGMQSVANLIGIIVNLTDYNVGADKGGEVSLFDQFDIDYNQYKYLIETYVSGALTKYKSAVIVMATASTDVLIDPVTAPTFVNPTGVVTIPTQSNVVYKNYDTGATLSAGAQTALAVGASITVTATPASGFYFSVTPNWTFTRVG